MGYGPWAMGSEFMTTRHKSHCYHVYTTIGPSLTHTRTMQNYKNLRVWEDAHALVLEIYNATRSFPNDERYGLTSQIRRAAVSISSNIAEGTGRGSDADFARFVQFAVGSISEVDYQLLLARDLNYVSTEAYAALNDQLEIVRRMTIALLKKLRARSS